MEDTPPIGSPEWFTWRRSLNYLRYRQMLNRHMLDSPPLPRTQRTQLVFLFLEDGTVAKVSWELRHIINMSEAKMEEWLTERECNYIDSTVERVEKWERLDPLLTIHPPDQPHALLKISPIGEVEKAGSEESFFRFYCQTVLGAKE